MTAPEKKLKPVKAVSVEARAAEKKLKAAEAQRRYRAAKKASAAPAAEADQQEVVPADQQEVVQPDQQEVVPETLEFVAPTDPAELSAPETDDEEPRVPVAALPLSPSQDPSDGVAGGAAPGHRGGMTVSPSGLAKSGKSGNGETGNAEDACSTRLSDDSTHSTKAAESGKSGNAPTVSNRDFVLSAFNAVPEQATPVICTKSGDPRQGGWPASPAKWVGNVLPHNNNFINCSSFYPAESGRLAARKDRFAACHFLMLDDLGSKVPFERLGGVRLSWLIETSPGNHQGGLLFDTPLTSRDTAIRLLDAIIAAGLCDAGSTGPLTRWARLPVAINGKEKYRDETGKPFACRLVEWSPETRYTPEQIVDMLQLELAPAGRPKKQQGASKVAKAANDGTGDVLFPKADENPVVAVLKARGLYKTPLGSGKHDVTCPWVGEHTDEADTGAAYFEPDEFYPLGGFCCQHSHRDKYHIRQLLEFLDVHPYLARHKAIVRIVQGDLHRVVDAAEKELAARGRHYQSGGRIVSITTDPTTGDPSIQETTIPALTRELSVAATWERYDMRSDTWVSCDPPQRHVGVLHDGQNFRRLLPLDGLARQPWFARDGSLIAEPGYHAGTQRFGVFDAKQFALPDPTPENAMKALAALEALLVEFPFAGPIDKAVALSAIFTAVTRPSLPFAPAFHVRATVFGSGKSFLNELVQAFAGPALDTSDKTARVSYPSTNEEATKQLLTLLLTGPAVINFDDMSTDWIPHGIINRALTAERITERILGVSKSATVSTRTLFLGSGNNNGPLRDLLRRVAVIRLDPRCETPATRAFKNNPVATVYKNRAAYVTAVLTIIRAWQVAGKPKTNVKSIATYNGEWSDYCRHPLIWLGQPDPAEVIFEQLKHDPDAEALHGLLTEWHNLYGSTPTTVRKAISDSPIYPDLRAAILEFPVEDKGGTINANRFGWLLKKHAGRIVKGQYFESVEGGNRLSWRVVGVG